MPVFTNIDLIIGRSESPGANQLDIVSDYLLSVEVTYSYYGHILLGAT